MRFAGKKDFTLIYPDWLCFVPPSFISLPSVQNLPSPVPQIENPKSQIDLLPFLLDWQLCFKVSQTKEECESGMEGGFWERRRRKKEGAGEVVQYRTKNGSSLHGVLMQKPAKSCKNPQKGRGEISKRLSIVRCELGGWGLRFFVSAGGSCGVRGDELHMSEPRWAAINRDEARLSATNRDQATRARTPIYSYFRIPFNLSTFFRSFNAVLLFSLQPAAGMRLHTPSQRLKFPRTSHAQLKAHRK